MKIAARHPDAVREVMEQMLYKSFIMGASDSFEARGIYLFMPFFQNAWRNAHRPTPAGQLPVPCETP